jgi:hypothetical protein
MTGRACVLRAMYNGADDEELAELALQCGDLPQPESLDRFVRRARSALRADYWQAAAANALSQLFGIGDRQRRL